MRLVGKWIALALALAIGIIVLTVQVHAEENDDWVSEVKALIEEENGEEVLQISEKSLQYDSEKNY